MNRRKKARLDKKVKGRNQEAIWDERRVRAKATRQEHTKHVGR